MHKIFIDKKNICHEKKLIYIRDENIAHIKALRLNREDEIIICDGDKNDYFCVIEQKNNNLIALRIINIKRATTEPEIKLFLFQALLKNNKLDFIIQKGVELGVNKIFIFISNNCERNYDFAKNKLLRWNKISKFAAEQSGRGIIPEIIAPINFRDAINLTRDINLNLIAHEKCETEKNFKKNLSRLAKSVSIFIGPEGGFTQEEIALAVKNNLEQVNFGKRILRAETAAIFAISVIMFELE